MKQLSKNLVNKSSSDLRSDLIIQEIELSKIVADPKAQPRVKLSKNTIDEYCEALLKGDKFPPIDVFYDGKKYHIGDGFHRFYAHKNAKRKTISIKSHKGGLREAILFSTGANSAHGLMRSAEDKAKAVLTLLNDKEWRNWSDRKLADLAKVSHPFVSKIRASFTNNSADHSENRTGEVRKFQRNGKVSNMKIRDSGRVDSSKKKIISPSQIDGEQKLTPIELANSLNTEISNLNDQIAYHQNEIENLRKTINSKKRELATLRKNKK